MRNKLFLIFIIFSLCFPSLLFSQIYFSTDTEEGIFSTDQKLSFYVHGPGMLRLYIDYIEIYLGRGPAYPELGVQEGESRDFLLSAEYYTVNEELAERFSWFITIDKIIPSRAELDFHNSQSGLGFTQISGDNNSAVRAWSDLSDSLVFIQDLRNVDIPPADSFPAIIWAETPAGNISDPRPEYFEISLVRVENPIAGSWQNPQTLLISGSAGRNVYWTIDGTNPLAYNGAGRLYQGPVRIEQRGSVSLRVSWREPDGREYHEYINYRVANDTVYLPELDNLIYAENRSLMEAVTIPIPDTWLWSIGSTRPEPGLNFPHLRGSHITLRPEDLVSRYTALHLVNPEETSWLYRFVYFLDGNQNRMNIPGLIAPGASRSNYSLGESPLFSMPYSMVGVPYVPPVRSIPELRLLYAGKSRLILWPETEGIIYFSMDPDLPPNTWLKGSSPLPLPLEGGTIRWIVFESDGSLNRSNDEAVSYYGPFTVNIEPLQTEPLIGSRGRIAYSYGNSGERPLWEYASDLMFYFPGIISSRTLDISDGEELQWAFITTSTRVLEISQRDRLPPVPPEIRGLPESLWTRGPVNLEIIPTETGTTGHINVRLVYPSGIVEMQSGTDSLVIQSSLDEIAEVFVEAYQSDSFGNQGELFTAQFTLDPKTIYVSDVPLLTSGIPLHRSDSAVGSMFNPFDSLDDAINYASLNNIQNIRINGFHDLIIPVNQSWNLTIDGDWADDNSITDNRAIIYTGSNFNWNINNSVILILNGIVIVSETLSSSLLNINEGFLAINDSEIYAESNSYTRYPVINSRNGIIEINSSNLIVSSNYALLFNLQGGRLISNDSFFLSRGDATGSLFNLNSSTGIFNESILISSAEDYASVLEAESGEVFINGGLLSLSAKDTSALFLNNTHAVLTNITLELDGDISARAIDFRGQVPLVRGSSFHFLGTAARSEVFSRDESLYIYLDPDGNEFSGFTHLMPGLLFTADFD